MTDTSLDQIWQTLNTIADPEIPVVSLVELGIVRDVQLAGEAVVVTITPTFAGCPAMHHMREEIFETLRASGVETVEVRVSLSPPWTSEWLSDEVRSKLRDFGLAPPPHHSGELEIKLMEVVECPYCGSKNTVMDNAFGPTLCQSIHYCRSCRQSFQRFKPL
jgi:ring-1,2-phenylacetyl-CoA epoxidase subunit PaaD